MLLKTFFFLLLLKFIIFFNLFPKYEPLSIKLPFIHPHFPPQQLKKKKYFNKIKIILSYKKDLHFRNPTNYYKSESSESPSQADIKSPFCYQYNRFSSLSSMIMIFDISLPIVVISFVLNIPSSGHSYNLQCSLIKERKN